MPVLDAQNLHKSLGSRTLLQDASLTIVRGEKVGVVGDNGSGKSTLGKILAGVLDADRGQISRRRGATVAYLEQEPPLNPGQTAEEVALSGLGEWRIAHDRYEQLCAQLADCSTLSEEELQELLAEQNTVTEKIEQLGGWNRRDEAGRILKTLGIANLTQDVSTMSGGERRRVALARLLISKPDLAILDEPTNHLDAENIEWLEQHLKTEFPGAVLLISHDRWLLSSVVTRTLEVEDGQVHSYDGGWEDFLMARAERRAQEERSEANRQNFLRKELEWLRRQPKARGTKQKARIDRANQAISSAPQGSAPDLALSLAESRTGGNVLETVDLKVGIGGRTLVEKLTFHLTRGDRVGIVGNSGAGKTTLLRTILGQIPPLSGEVRLGKNTKIAYLDQTRGGLENEDTVFDAITGGRPSVKIGDQDLSSYSYLKRFRFTGDTLRQQVGGLSGGERSRVALAKLLLSTANVLVLDEPTNDLDVMTLSALEELVLGLKGAALIVSHDRYFLDRVSTSILGLDGAGNVHHVQGGYTNYSEYREELARAQKDQKAAQKTADSAPAGSARRESEALSKKTPEKSAEPLKKPEPPKKKLTYAEELELTGLLENVERFTLEVTVLEEQLADPLIYVERREEAARVEKELSAKRELLERTELRWLELEERRT